MTRFLILDLRSLAVLRIGLAALLLYDLIDRARDLTLYYTDFGFLPRTLVTTEYWNSAWWCVHLFSGFPREQAFLFLLHGLAAVGLMVGWRTRLCTVLCYLLTLSLHNRNPLVLDSGDRLFLILFLWGLFLPWGARFSLDARGLSSEVKGGDLVLLPGGLGYLFQIVSLYLMAAVWKIHPVWLTEKTALSGVFELFALSKPLGHFLLDYPRLLKLLTLGTVLVEGLAPCLLLLGNSRWRLLGVSLLAVLHIGIALTMDLELFPLVPLVSLAGLLPSLVWRTAPQDGALGRTWRWARGRLTHILAFLVLLLTVGWNSYTLTHRGDPPRQTSGAFQWPAQVISAVRLAQFWNLYAPVPPSKDSRYLVAAKLTDDTLVDLLRQGRPFSFAAPRYPYREFRNQHQRNYLTKLQFTLGDSFRRRFLLTLAHRWNRQYPERKVRWLRFVVVRTDTILTPGKPEISLLELGQLVPPGSLWQGPLEPLEWSGRT